MKVCIVNVYWNGQKAIQFSKIALIVAICPCLTKMSQNLHFIISTLFGIHHAKFEKLTHQEKCI
jgi:hypothetical protein